MLAEPSTPKSETKARLLHQAPERLAEQDAEAKRLGVSWSELARRALAAFIATPATE